jgi:hypothetical protein
VLELELEWESGSESESGLVSELGLELELESESESVLSLALQTRGVCLTAVASVQESEGASAEGVEQARMRLAAARQHRVGLAVVHHWCQSRSTRFPARPFAPEI